MFTSYNWRQEENVAKLPLGLTGKRLNLPINKRQDSLPNHSSKHCLVSKTEALNFPAEQLTSTMTTLFDLVAFTSTVT